ncbi:hypothetical protein [Streptomyces sp. 8N616]|uniref:hypothetical protein n=1 Tax=Streptomyces sp. 8N616 TaxID=3457414 RepID=UPI003FD15B6E
MVENIIELERFRKASKESARTAIDLQPGETLTPHPTIPRATAPAGSAISRSP